MARKSNGDYDLDDLNFDDFELDEFADFDSMNKPKNSREAITNLAGNFVSGMSQGLLKPENQRKMISKGLPPGYTVAYDNIQEGVQGVSEVMDEVSKGMDDLIKSTKKTVDGFVPAMEKVLPEKILAGIKKWSHQENPFAGRSGPTQDDIIASNLADLTEAMKGFAGKSTNDRSKQRKMLSESDAVNLSSSAVTNKLLENQTEQILAIRKLASRSVAATEQVTFKFQQKSLELMYQQLFTVRKLLDTSEQSLALQRDAFEKITHNTGLPDIVKVKNNELGGQLLKQHAFESLYNSSKPVFARVGRRIVQQARGNIKNFFQDMNGQVSDVNMLFDMLGDGDMVDPKELMASMAGGFAADFGSKYIGKGIKKFTQGNEKLERQSLALQNFFNEKNSYLKNMMNSSNPLDSNPIIEFIRDKLGGDALFEEKSTIVRSAFKESDLDEPTTLRWRSVRTIEDIIPGWLRMMHNELQMIRTGNHTLKPWSFDSRSGLFKSKDDLKAKLKDELLNRNDLEAHSENVANVLKVIDPEGKLSVGTRNKLLDHIIELRNDPDKAFNLKDIAADNTRIGLSYDEVEELHALVNEFEGGTWTGLDRNGINAIKDDFNSSQEYQEYRMKINKAMSRLKAGQRDNREAIADHVKGGNLDILRELGIVDVDDSGDVNQNEKMLHQMIRSGTQKYLAHGGWTGPGDKHEGAGLVHKDEYVIQKKVTSQPGAKRFLDLFNAKGMDAIRGYDVGGAVGLERGYDTVGETKSKGIGDAILDAIRSNNATDLFNETNSRLDALVALNQQIAERGYGVVGLPNVSSFKRAGGWLKNLGIKTFNWSKTPVKSGWNTGKLGVGMAQSFVFGKAEKLKLDMNEMADAAIDVYNKYSDKPIFTRKGFLNGEYFDKKTKKVLRSLKDIKGDVVDASGNIIASAEDFADGLYTSSGRNLKSVFSWFGGIISKYGPSAIKSTIAGWKRQLNVVRHAKAIVARAWNIMDDVYVKGEDSPRLMARILNTHKYYRKHDGQAVKSYKDLTGEIVDADGNVVLSVEDMRKGLVDAKGNPIGTRMERLFNSVKKVFTGAKKALTGVKDFGVKMISAGWDASTALLGGMRDLFFGGGISVMGRGSKNVLFEIRDILDKRLPSQAKAIFGDTDGDGDRDNSWQDIIARRKEKEAADKDKKGDDAKLEKKKSGWGLMSILTGIGSMVSGVYTALKTGIGSMVAWLRRIAMAKTLTQGASAAGDLLGGGRGRRAGRGGVLSRAGRFLSRGPGWAKVAGGAALAGGAYYAMKDDEPTATVDATGRPMAPEEPGVLRSMWNGMTDGGTADGVASFGASTALTTAGMVAATGAIAGGMAGTGIAAGALAALGGPITLGVIGVGAAVWAGAKLYKKFSSGGNSLNSFRMMQYGFNPSENKDQVARIAALEELLAGHTRVSKDGQITINNSVSYKDIMAIFEVKDESHLAQLDHWFKARFKPIFGKWLQAFQSETGRTNLSAVDNLDKTKRVKILAAVHSANMGEYSVTTSPFKTPATTTVNGGAIHENFKSLEKRYASAAKKVASQSGTTPESEGGIMNTLYNVGKTAFGFTPIGFAMKTTSAAWDGIKSAGSWVADKAGAVGGAIANGASAVGSAIGGGWNALMGGLKSAGKAVAGAASTVGSTLSDAYQDTFGSGGYFQGTGGSVGDIPQAKGKGWAGVKDTILAAAKMVGVEPALMASIAAIESGFNPSAKAGTSSAAGLYQFISGTWKSMINKYGKTYGIPANASPLDARANAVLGAAFIKDNAQVIKSIKGSVSPVDVYMAHFLGVGGVRQFLTAMKKNPSAPAAQAMPQAASANKSIFYDGGRMRSFSEIYQLMLNKVNTKAGQHGVDLKSLSSGGSGSAPAAPGTNTAAPKGIPATIAKPGATKAPPVGIAKPELITGAAARQSQADNVMKNATASVANKAGAGTAPTASESAGASAGNGDKLERLLRQATPELVSNGKNYTSLNGNVLIKGMNTKFMTLFYAMVGDAIKKGVIKRVDVNSAYRSPEKQQQLYAQYLRNGKPMAAKPGKSNHEKGLAIDINSAQANALATAGLLQHWGFFRPLLNHKSHPEPWHIEHAYFTSGASTAKATQTGAGAQAGTPAAQKEAVKYDRNKNGGRIVGVINPGDPVPQAIAIPTDTKATDTAKRAETASTKIISPNAVATGNANTVSKPLSVPDTSSTGGQGLTERKKSQAELDKEILDRQAVVVSENKQRRQQADEMANVASNKYLEQSVMHQASMDHTLKQLLNETQAMHKSLGGLTKGLVDVATANAKAPAVNQQKSNTQAIGFSTRDPISLDA